MIKFKSIIRELYGGGYMAYLETEFNLFQVVGGKSFSKKKVCQQAIEKLEKAIEEFKQLAEKN